MEGRRRLYEMMRDEIPVEERVFGKEEDGLRSPFVQFLNCKNLLIENIYLHNSPFWSLHIVWCENVTVRGITIENQTNSPNTDGVNIDASRHVLVEDCKFITLGDDMLCLKAGRNEDGRAVGRCCEDVSCEDVELGIAIEGLFSAEMKNLHFKNIKMNAKTCFSSDTVDGLYTENLQLFSKE